METHNNLLIISGDGRESGKTSMACRIIRSNSEKGIIAIKICPHFHELNEMELIIKYQGEFEIFREKSLTSAKDSSLMLKAGAAEVFYVQCNDKALASVWKEIEKLIHTNQPVICESGGLAGIIKAGLHILMKGSPQNKAVSIKPDVVINKNDITAAAESVRFTGENWEYIG